MLVQPLNYRHALDSLRASEALGVDTETTGLRPHHGDRLFSIIIADADDAYYFDFQTEGWQPDLQDLQQLFQLPKIWYFANAKFDLAMLENFGVSEVVGTIHDLQTHERLLDSTLFGKVFSLEKIGERYAYKKDDKVKEWIFANGAFTKTPREGKKGFDEQLHFDRVPKLLMIPYACQDAAMTRAIGEAQRARLIASESIQAPSLMPLVENERQLTRTVYAMEKAGVKIDRQFCLAAAAYESGRRRGLLEKFQTDTGVPFVDSAKTLAPLFSGVKLLHTPKGAPTFAAEALATYNHPLASLITGIRDAKSKADYYHGFLAAADGDDVIHSSLNQHQAVTGRFSSSNPNLQNLTRPDEDDEMAETLTAFQVRRAIVPRPGFFFAMFDFDQMEYRLMLEYAGCRALIDKVLGGLDVHAATALLAGITRQQAKQTNFLTIFGGGDGILAAKLGLPLADAKRVRGAIFEAAPEIRDFMQACISRARERGFLFNWFGRRQYFPDPETAYRGPNHIIQGGCADVAKICCNRVHARLRGMRTRLVLMVHDELVLECPESEASVLPEIRAIMEAVYPFKWLKLTAGASHSFKSLADKVKGYPA